MQCGVHMEYGVSVTNRLNLQIPKSEPRDYFLIGSVSFILIANHCLPINIVIRPWRSRFSATRRRTKWLLRTAMRHTVSQLQYHSGGFGIYNSFTSSQIFWFRHTLERIDVQIQLVPDLILFNVGRETMVNRWIMTLTFPFTPELAVCRIRILRILQSMGCTFACVGFISLNRSFYQKFLYFHHQPKCSIQSTISVPNPLE